MDLYLCAGAAVTTLQLLLLKKKQQNRKKRTIWSKDWLKRRHEGRGILSMLNDELIHEDRDAYENFLRMDNNLFCQLLKKIEPQILKQDTVMRESISPRDRLQVTLRFLATGETYRSLMYATRIHEATISRFVPEVCSAIYNELKEHYLKAPSSEEEWKMIASDFYRLWDFPNCIGALDGRHIEFRPPKSAGSYYYNYKGANSIVLLGLVDANYRFIYVNVGTNGRISDGGVLRESGLGNALKSNSLNLPVKEQLPGRSRKIPYVIVADDAFPLTENIMKPYAQRGLSQKKRIFNYRLSRARRIVENAFGILANRFRVLLNPMNLAVNKVEIITLCCVALHNYLAQESLEYFNDIRGYKPNIKNKLNSLGQQGGTRSSLNARLIRVELTNFFSSPLGIREWQDRQILKNNL